MRNIRHTILHLTKDMVLLLIWRLSVNMGHVRFIGEPLYGTYVENKAADE